MPVYSVKLFLSVILLLLRDWKFLNMKTTKLLKPSVQQELDQIRCSLHMPKQFAYDHHTGSET